MLFMRACACGGCTVAGLDHLEVLASLSYRGLQVGGHQGPGDKNLHVHRIFYSKSLQYVCYILPSRKLGNFNNNLECQLILRMHVI